MTIFPQNDVTLFLKASNNKDPVLIIETCDADILLVTKVKEVEEMYLLLVVKVFAQSHLSWDHDSLVGDQADLLNFPLCGKFTLCEMMKVQPLLLVMRLK